MTHINLFKNDTFSDIFIKSDTSNTYFPAHRCLLATKSIVFNTLFTHKHFLTYTEKKNNKKVYTIGNSCDKSLDLFLIYFYIDELKLSNHYVNKFKEYDWDVDILWVVCDLFARFCTNYECFLKDTFYHVFINNKCRINDVIVLGLLYKFDNIIVNLVGEYLHNVETNNYEFSEHVLNNPEIYSVIAGHLAIIPDNNQKIQVLTKLLCQPSTSIYKKLLGSNTLDLSEVTESILSTCLTQLVWYDTHYPHIALLNKVLNNKMDDVLSTYPLTLSENKIGTIINVIVRNTDHILYVKCETSVVLTQGDHISIQCGDIVYSVETKKLIYECGKVYIGIGVIMHNGIKHDLSIDLVSKIYGCSIYYAFT